MQFLILLVTDGDLGVHAVLGSAAGALARVLSPSPGLLPRGGSSHIRKGCSLGWVLTLCE